MLSGLLLFCELSSKNKNNNEKQLSDSELIEELIEKVGRKGEIEVFVESEKIVGNNGCFWFDSGNMNIL